MQALRYITVYLLTLVVVTISVKKAYFSLDVSVFVQTRVLIVFLLRKKRPAHVCTASYMLTVHVNAYKVCLQAKTQNNEF